MISRKQFIRSHDATCKNWTWSWSFVNHEKKLIIFGAWDKNTQRGRSQIFSENWARTGSGRKLAAFGQSREHIRLIEEEGYELQTFPIKYSEVLKDEYGNGPAKIVGLTPQLERKILVRDGVNWYAYNSALGWFEDVYELTTIEDIEGAKSRSKTLSATTRDAIVQSRIGQGQFRTSLVKYWSGCAVTGCKQIEILRASHIKPWRFSSNAERLNRYNGLLLIPNIDTCFDLGLISFDVKGKILISSKLNKATMSQVGINSSMRLIRVDKRHRAYLRYHLENVFCA